MSLKINYLIPSNKNEILLGRIIFFDNFIPSAITFPYFYLGAQGETLNYYNWPNLVPYLYDKKLGFFTTINNVYQYKNNFEIYSFTTTTGTLTLKFKEANSIKALKSLYEDMMVHYFENNNSFVGWNRTITPLSDIGTENLIFLNANMNYKIDTLQISNDNSLATITIKTSNNQTVIERELINKNIEFGLYRLENKTNRQSIFFNGIKGKYFSTSDSESLIGGLRTRSQLIGHTHLHTHDMNNHTHTMQHTHPMSHTHGMEHSHFYGDSKSNTAGTGGGGGGNYTTGGAQYDDNNTTAASKYLGSESGRDYTDGPSTSNTGLASLSTTTIPSNNLLTSISAKTINKDDIYTNSDNFKIGNKNHYDANITFAYIYGGSYVP